MLEEREWYARIALFRGEKMKSLSEAIPIAAMMTCVLPAKRAAFYARRSSGDVENFSEITAEWRAASLARRRANEEK